MEQRSRVARLALADLGALLGLAIWTLTQVAVGNFSQLPVQFGFQILAALVIVLSGVLVVVWRRDRLR